ncbi:MAG: radical SAM protein, partial [Candidatus Wallbacteria bacterium]|nr:radical SAM protein [Candidatus Wallbacteria bacterium]
QPGLPTYTLPHRALPAATINENPEAGLILLLNPPFHKPVLRDYFCSHYSKGRYIWQPLDFVYLSGLLLSRGTDFCVYDAICRKASQTRTMEYIKKLKPSVIVALSGAATLPSDLAFFRRIKAEPPETKILTTGDVFLFHGREILSRRQEIDGVLFHFLDSSLADYLQQGHGLNVLERGSEKLPVFPKRFTLHTPAWEWFSHPGYNLPYLQEAGFQSLLCAFSCPHECFYCPFEKLPFVQRDPENIYTELRSLKSRGVRYLFIRDQSFNPGSSFYQEILLMLRRFSFRFSISARPEHLVKWDLVNFLREAGCDLVQIGVETANQSVLEPTGKNLPAAELVGVFNNLRRQGIRTLTHMILGFPGDNAAIFQDNRSLLKQLDPDFLSINILAPQPGTSLRDSLSYHVDPDCDFMDSSFTPPVFGSIDFRKSVMQERALLSMKFYLSPTFIMRTFRGASVFSLRILALEAVSYAAKLDFSEIFNIIRICRGRG